MSPPTVTLSVLSSELHHEGESLILQCQATVSHHINTPVSVDFVWRVSDGRTLTSATNTRVAISDTTAVSVYTYQSNLTFRELIIMEDSNLNYFCEAMVMSTPVSPYILPSSSSPSNTYHLNVTGNRLHVCMSVMIECFISVQIQLPGLLYPSLPVQSQ